MSLPILVDTGVLSASAGADSASAAELGAGTVGAAPVMTAVVPPGLDPTSVLASSLTTAHAAEVLETLGQFTGQRALFGMAKELSAGTFTAIEAINAAAAVLGG